MYFYKLGEEKRDLTASPSALSLTELSKARCFIAQRQSHVLLLGTVRDTFKQMPGMKLDANEVNIISVTCLLMEKIKCPYRRRIEKAEAKEGKGESRGKERQGDRAMGISFIFGSIVVGCCGIAGQRRWLKQGDR